jgi:hypothetical protein
MSREHFTRSTRFVRADQLSLTVLILVALCQHQFLVASDQDGQSPQSRPKPSTSSWKPLFDGKTLDGWEVVHFGGDGEVEVSDGCIHMDFGAMLTGITYKKDFPVTDYEIRLEAKRVDGIDFFCGLTFPVGKNHCSLIVGGWAGAVVGLSSIDDRDASENDTTKYMNFEDGRWYRIRVRVTRDRIQAWIDGKPMVDQDIRNRKVSTRAEVDLSKPLGIAAWQTRAALRKIEYRRLTEGTP